MDPVARKALLTARRQALLVDLANIRDQLDDPLPQD